MLNRILGFFLSLGLCLTTSLSHAVCAGCCTEMGGVNYCDSSAGRYVCNNGYYSSCYCTIHAVMDLQQFEGCCLWQGGVMLTDSSGQIICNNGGVSAICSLQKPYQSVY